VIFFSVFICTEIGKILYLLLFLLGEILFQGMLFRKIKMIEEINHKVFVGSFSK